MRILYFVQYFNLPHEPGGSRPYQFARAWVREGHQVTIVTGAVNHKTLTVPDKYRGRLVVHEDVEGIRVLRVWTYAGIRGSFKKRLLNFVSYVVSATIVGWLRGGSADAVYASSTPLTVGIPGWLASVVKRAPFVFELRDLWPQSAVVAGILDAKNLLTKFAGWLARFLYRRAKRCVAVTRGIGDGLVEVGVPREKVVFVPNGVDDWMVEAGESPVEPAADDMCRVVYCGAHGRWNGLGQILDAAALLKPEDGVSLSFIGDGDDREKLKERANADGLDRIEFQDALPKRDAFDQLRRATATIVVTWNHPFQRMVLANKIFDYLAAGRPVIVGADGEMADLVREAQCGLIVPPEDPPRLANAMKEMAAMPESERREMGRRGRRYILEHYQRRDLAWRLLQLFSEITGKPADGLKRPKPQAVES